MIDGFWNNDLVSVGNVDSMSCSFFDGKSYSSQMFYRDVVFNILVDQVFYYWVIDVWLDIDDNIKLYIFYLDQVNFLVEYWNLCNDLVIWQYMVIYILGLGLIISFISLKWEGFIYFGGYDEIVVGCFSWLNVLNNYSNNVYDLWYVVVNFWGEFFSVDLLD